MSEIKLLPYPFCSGKVEIRQKGHSSYYGGCVNGCFISSSEYDKNVLTKQLNTRKPMQGILEKLQDELELSGKEKVRTIDNPYQFRRVQGYSDGIAVAIDFVREVGGMNENRK